MNPQTTPRQILVASDLSEPAQEALREAARRALLWQARLVVLHVALYPAPIHPVFPHLSQRDVDDEIRLGREITDQLSEQVAEVVDPAVEVDVVVDFGVPYVAIVR